MDDSFKKIVKDASKTEDLDQCVKKQRSSDQLMTQLEKSLPEAPKHKKSQLLSPELIPPSSAEEINSYQSASVFLKAIAEEAMQWKENLPENYEPAILALVYGGLQINVLNLSQVSFHGIRLEGTLNDSPCSLLAHQSTVQMLCYGKEIVEGKQKRPIGFIWEDQSIEV